MKEQQKYYLKNGEVLDGPYVADELLNNRLNFCTPIVRAGFSKSIPLKECKELMEYHKANRQRFPPILRKEYEGNSNEGRFYGLKIFITIIGVLLVLIKLVRLMYH